LQLGLARRGWKPHRFPDSNVVVFLPQDIAAGHDPEGVLHGSTTGTEIELSATLHRGFEDRRRAALEFVSHLARKNRRTVREVGTYRYYYDPTDADVSDTALRFWVIGIPGAVVVLSILCRGKKPVSDPLQEVHDAIPYLVGEIL
jgi:hypothetical protein